MKSEDSLFWTVEDILFKAFTSPGKCRMWLIKKTFPELVDVIDTIRSWHWDDEPPMDWQTHKITVRCNICGAPRLERCHDCGSSDLESPSLDANRYCNSCGNVVN